ncbi:MAG: STAS domain-containing protein [Gemmatimonadota bacterium]|nr:STAS domain-containing protein [Gemmatimonadota bacterium]
MNARDGAALSISRRSGPHPGGVVVAVEGDLIFGACDSLRDAVERELADGATRVVVDLAKATHVDMPAFALFVELHDRSRETDTEVVVAALPEPFRRVSDALRLPDYLRMTDDVEAAFDSTA